MTEAEMQERLQVAQDMIDTIIQQRDANANTVAQLNARVKQLERRLAERPEAPVVSTTPDTSLNGHTEATAH